MFDTKHQLIVFLVLTLFQFYNSKSIRDEPFFKLFVANPTPAPGATAKIPQKPILATRPPVIKKTTYDWGQWTKTQAPGSQTTYDWGQHTGNGTTYDWGQHTGNGTTYDWGQHTGNGTRTTYDWGQHTGSTSSPNSNSTGNGTEAPASRTTYDWGQHTGSRTTYDWGQHTSPNSNSTANGTEAPASRTTYDWGQHTGSRTTYDWGQHTGSTVSPGDDNSTVTENPDDNGNEYRCPAGKYTCKGTIGLCISLTQICDRKQDCPHRDDEDPKVCFPGFGGNKNKKKNYNNFAGTGFMFNVRNIIIRDKSVAKLFDQQSDNRNTDVIQKSQ